MVFFYLRVSYEKHRAALRLENAVKLCLKSAEVEQSGFCHEKMKVTKPILLQRKSDQCCL